MHSPGPVQDKLISRHALVILLTVLGGLLVGSFFTLHADRDLESIRLSDLHMTSWNLARLEQEASALDKAMALVRMGADRHDELRLKYDVLWSRLSYLLESSESAPARNHADYEDRFRTLFDRLKAMEPDLLAVTRDRTAIPDRLLQAWLTLDEDIELLLARNFIDGETGLLMNDIEASRARLALFRKVTLIGLIGFAVYLLITLVHVRRRSRIDPLTGLPNNAVLAGLSFVPDNTLVIACQVQGYRRGMLTIGVEGCEHLTREVARRLSDHIGDRDQLICSSRDEFIILAQGRTPADNEAFIKGLSSVLHFEWHYRRATLPIRSVVGADLPQPQPIDWPTRYQNALLAKQWARDNNQRLVIYSHDLRETLETDKAVLAAMIDLFQGKPSDIELSCRYQPAVSVADPQRIESVEALLRGYHSRFGFIAPNRLVDLCEQNGLGRQLGHWLFEHLARETRVLFQDHRFRGILSINLNPSLIDPSLPDDVQRLLIDQGIPGTSLCMEITEDNAALQFKRVNPIIDELKKRGVHFALDDFGTGHSSLEYVRELKVSRLKIDRCFVDGIDTNPRNHQFLLSMLRLTQHLNLGIVVEGVETEAQWRALTPLNDIWVQGYFMHRPLTMDELLTVLTPREVPSPLLSERSC